MSEAAARSYGPEITVEQNPETRRETRDVSARLIAALLGGIAAFVVVSILALLAFYPGARHGGVIRPEASYPEPRLQSHPTADLQRFETAVGERLESWGYVDAGRTVAHIAIEAAMRRIADQGIPDWPAPKP